VFTRSTPSRQGSEKAIEFQCFISTKGLFRICILGPLHKAPNPGPLAAADGASAWGTTDPLTPSPLERETSLFVL